MRILGETLGGTPEQAAAAAEHAEEKKGNGAAPNPGAELAEFARKKGERDAAKKKPKGKGARKGGVKAQAAAAERKGKGKGKAAKKGKDKAKGGKAAKAPAAKKSQGIGAFCETLLKQKKSTEEIMKAVHAKFPGAKTSPASIAWYRTKMREEGTLPKA